MKSRSILLAVGAIAGHALGLAAQDTSPHTHTHTPAADSAQAQRIFDAHLQPPIDVLRDLYKRKKVLILAHTSHEIDYSKVLLPLLDQIGTDPALRYITSERDYSTAPTLEALSVTPFREADLLTRFSLEERKEFCWAGRELAMDLTTLLPALQQLNARRPAARPVRFTAMDGGALVAPIDREEGSAAHFAALWRRLGPSGKIIVTYANGHIAKDADRGTPGGNWLTRFLKQHPKARRQMAIVELNYKAVPGHPGQSGGVQLAPLARLPQWKDYAEQRRYDGVLWWANPVEYPSISGAGFWTAIKQHGNDVNDWQIQPLDSIKPLAALPVLCSAKAIQEAAQAALDSARARQAAQAAKPAAP